MFISRVSLVIVAGVAILSSQTLRAADRWWIGGTSNELTLGGGGGNWGSNATNNTAGATTPGTADQGIFRQGQPSGSGISAPTNMTVTGTLSPRNLRFENLVDVVVGGDTVRVTPGSASRYIDSGNATANVTFNNATLRFNVVAASDTGIAGSLNASSTFKVDTTSFLMATGSATNAKNFIETASVANPGNIVINPTVDFTQTSANQTLSMTSYGTGIITLNNGITGGGSNLNVNINPGTDFATRSVIVVGGTSAFTGTTTVNDGTLKLANATYNGSGNVSIGATATLTGNGSILSSVVLDGTVAPGSSAGTLTFGGLTLTTASLSYDLTAGDFAVGSGINDWIQVGGIVNLTGLGVVNVTSAPLTPGVYTLISGNSIVGAASDLSLGTYSLDPSASSAQIVLNGTNVNLVVNPVPEPTALSLIGIGTILAGGRMYRRSRDKKTPHTR